MKKFNHFIIFLLVFLVLGAGTVQARTSSWQKALIVGTLLHVLLPQPQVVVTAPPPAVVYPSTPVVYPAPVVVAPSPVVVYPRTRVVYPRTHVVYPSSRVVYPSAPSHHAPRHHVAPSGNRPGGHHAPRRHAAPVYDRSHQGGRGHR